MSLSRTDIAQWFDRACDKGATHMLVVADTYDYSYCPEYVFAPQDPRAVVEKVGSQAMTKVMELYSMSLDKETQLSERRAFHYE